MIGAEAARQAARNAAIVLEVATLFARRLDAGAALSPDESAIAEIMAKHERR